MDSSPEVDEKLWNAWVARGKKQSLEAARMAKIFGAVGLIAALLALRYYFSVQ
jgi:hypothetical protein